MYSHLVFAPGDSTEDGQLEARELMKLNLKADLVVLSACETARGRYVAGVALHKPLSGARVPTISKAQALRQAELQVLRKAGTSHPFYWAGFVLIGDGR